MGDLMINSNSLAAAKASLTQTTSLAAVKEAEAMRIAMAIAKNYPRNLAEVEDKIFSVCNRRRLAEAAEFVYRRGKTDIRGASIKLVEAVAQCYGNIESGVKELQRLDDKSECLAFAWDLENNIKVTREFTVPHYRDNTDGKTRLTSDRDIREMIFNYGSRNVRACLERVMPRDLIELALETCQAALENDNRTLADKITDCKKRFKNEFNISGEFLERLVGEKSANWTNSHLKQLAGYFNALKDGNVTKKDLEAECVKNISTAQIKELAGAIGTDEKKIEILKAFGYSMSDIKNIPEIDFDKIKQAICDDEKA